MSKIIYSKQSLFDTPEGSYLVHSCNCMGVWGSGIAKEFKEKFPTSFEMYNLYCKVNRETKGSPLGYSLITDEKVVCLFTSNNYGKLVDKPYQVLVNTVFSLEDFMWEISDRMQSGLIIYSNKFNSGLFNVPWEQTEYVLNDLLNEQPHIKNWVVCDPNM